MRTSLTLPELARARGLLGADATWKAFSGRAVSRCSLDSYTGEGIRNHRALCFALIAEEGPCWDRMSSIAVSPPCKAPCEEL